MISKTGQLLIETLFKKDEEVCVSHDGYGYRSVPVSHLNYETLELVSPNSDINNKIISTSEIKLIAVNPTQGFRRDENVTSFRNFLIEIDDMPLADQLAYADEMKLPYSICVFSGNKSLHFSVCLEETLPSYKLYYYYATWILRIMNKADQKTKNPTRSIRFPGATRDGREQKLVKLRKRITLETLNAWLSEYNGLRPTEFDESKKPTILPDINREELIPRWVWSKLHLGINPQNGRNLEWFKIASEFGKAGYQNEDTIAFLEQYFTSEFDFKRNEWSTAIKSGVKNGRKKAGLE
jgi:hypothetical protein